MHIGVVVVVEVKCYGVAKDFREAPVISVLPPPLTALTPMTATQFISFARVVLFASVQGRFDGPDQLPRRLG